MLKYKVILGWRTEFIFDDPDTAMNFAVTAMLNQSGDNDRDTIRIELHNPDNENEEERDDD